MMSARISRMEEENNGLFRISLDHHSSDRVSH
jgi:hypothetical protein